MSLQVWLSLTKDLRNQGLATIEQLAGTAVFKDNGKIGNKSLNLHNYLTFNCPTLSGKKNFSFCFWYKPETSTSTVNWNDVVAFFDSGGGLFRLETSYGYSNYILSMHNNTSYAIFPNSGGSYGSNLVISSARDIWYHVAVIVSETEGINCYINNELKFTIAHAGGSITGKFNLGEYASGGNEEGSLNDFRIYDHCLSPMEVKELSKGLVLHYPLNRQGWGQENLLLTNSNPTTTSLTGWGANGGSNFILSNVASSGASGGRAIRVTYTGTSKVPGGIFKLLGTDPTTLESGANYTISARLRASKNCQLTLYNEAMSYNSNEIVINVTTEWQTFSYTAPVNYGGTYSANIIGIPSTQVSQNMWVECDWTKFEKGDKATPWCPNASESLYASLGLNGIIEYDCSGFCNNGTRTGTFSWTSDAPKYKVSTAITVSNSKITSPRLLSRTQPLTSDYTVALWAKLDSNATQVSRIYNGVCALNFQPSGPYISYSYSTSSNSTTGSSKTITTDVWLHMAMVYSQTDATITIYFDGKKHYTYTNMSTVHSCEAQETLFGSNPPGLVSDVRVYATALSADDIKSLYQNEAQLDTLGNVIGPIR